MKVALLINKRGAALYTAAALRTAMHHYGIQEVGIGDADAIWVSMCDPTELPLLQRARKIAGHRPVVMGGFEAWFSVPYLAWADAIVVGEAYEFMEAWSKSPDTAMTLPCIATKQKPSTIPSEIIKWDLAPLLCVPGHRRYMYLASRGCHKRCLFCAVGCMQKYQSNTQERLEEVARTIYARKSRLTWITNDSKNLPQAPVDVHSVTAVDYMANPTAYKCSLVRIGVEGWTEEDRKALGKPLSDAQLHELMRVLSMHKQPCEMYLMADYPGWNMDKVDDLCIALGKSDTPNPPVWIKVTYFDPCPGTPLGNVPVQGQWCDTTELFHAIGTRNRRIRVWGTRSRARSAWRTLLHRCSADEALRLSTEPTDTNTACSYAVWVDTLATEHRRLLV